MPVLYAAVGRRLGYPLTLVHTKAHVFARWDDPEGRHPLGPERFNIEATGPGFSRYPDEYYETWPLPTTEQERTDFCYLRSLSPREELAAFLANRGACLQDNLRLLEAQEAFSRAHELAPDNRQYVFMNDVNLALCGVPVPEGWAGLDALVRKEATRLDSARRTRQET
jgi:hypothetical protein